MPDLLGATNPVPGYDRSVTNRSDVVSPNNNHPQIQNTPNLDRVSHADGRTEQQGSDLQGRGNIRYDSNYQTFLQRLKETPGMAETMTRIFSGREGTVVLSGMQDGISTEMAKILEMLRMDEKQLLDFMSGQLKAGTRFNGVLFDFLRNAYSRAGSDTVRTDILQFMKSYVDHSSTEHIQNSMMNHLSRMADAMPASFADKLRQMMAELQNSMAAGDRQGGLQILQKNIFPFMARYVEQTHDMGLPRQLLSMLALDVARYENGSEGRLQELFHQLRGYGTLKGQLQMIDDDMLMKLLEQGKVRSDSPAAQFSNTLAAAAERALRGEGSQEIQQGFQNLVAAMLVNESVYMPVNHYLIPLQWEDRMLFSEMWVDPDDNAGVPTGMDPEGKTMRFLLKIDVQSLGLFDVLLVTQKDKVDVQISCPDGVAPFARQIEDTVSQILTRNALSPLRVAVRRLERPVTLTEVFPKIFQRRSGVDVKA